MYARWLCTGTVCNSTLYSNTVHRESGCFGLMTLILELQVGMTHRNERAKPETMMRLQNANSVRAYVAMLCAADI